MLVDDVDADSQFRDLALDEESVLSLFFGIDFFLPIGTTRNGKPHKDL